jgi:hypothetical protein
MSSRKRNLITSSPKNKNMSQSFIKDYAANWEDIHRVNLPLYACGARQLPPYQLLGYLKEFWEGT